MNDPLPLRAPESASNGMPSITVLAIFAIVIGALGTVGCGMLGLSESLTVQRAGGLVTGTNKTIPFDRSLLIFTTTVAVLDLLTSAALTVTAYAALRRWSWGRKTAVVVSGVILLLVAVKLGGSAGYFRQTLIDIRMAAFAEATPEQQAVLPGIQQVRTMSIVAPLMNVLLQGLAPGLIAIVWTRPSVKAGFDERSR